MGHIFISYSRRDSSTVNRIVEAMKELGLDVWIDQEDIKAGDTWRVQIVQAIDTCDAFVLMLSSNSAASDNVRKEIDLAQDSGRTIFVMLLAPVKLPSEIRYQLAGLQYIDFSMVGFDKAVGLLNDALVKYQDKLKPAIKSSTRQVELVIQGIDPAFFGAEKQEQLLEFVSHLSSADRSQLKIVNITAGSIHAFVEMPATFAFELKTLALNRDRRFKRFGVVSLRILGDFKFINISFGILTTTATISLLKALWLKIPPLLSSVFGAMTGKILTVLIAFIAVTLVLLYQTSFQPETIRSTAIQPTIIQPTPFQPTKTQPTPIQPTEIQPTAIQPMPTEELPQYYTEQFDKDLKYWPYFLKNVKTNFIVKDPVDGVTLKAEDGFLTFDMETTGYRAYSIYDSFNYEDVRIDARMQILDTSDNYFSLVCRYSKESGWYDFTIINGGLYDIKFAEPREDGYVNYTLLADGGSNNIKQGTDFNEYTAICKDDILTLYINGNLTNEVKDAQLKSGKIGVSVASFQRPPTKVNVDWIKISPP